MFEIFDCEEDMDAFSSEVLFACSQTPQDQLSFGISFLEVNFIALKYRRCKIARYMCPYQHFIHPCLYTHMHRCSIMHIQTCIKHKHTHTPTQTHRYRHRDTQRHTERRAERHTERHTGTMGAENENLGAESKSLHTSFLAPDFRTQTCSQKVIDRGKTHKSIAENSRFSQNIVYSRKHSRGLAKNGENSYKSLATLKAFAKCGLCSAFTIIPECNSSLPNMLEGWLGRGCMWFEKFRVYAILTTARS